MKVTNIHKRIINQPKEKINELLRTLSTNNDKVWPTENWPAMKFKNGLKEGAKGGHGPIGYTVQKYKPGELIQFKFTKPHGFNGIHKFEITELKNNKTELVHTIDMNTSVSGTLYWAIAVRWLHDALVEDAFDKVENHLACLPAGFSKEKKKTPRLPGGREWNIWVKILRKILT